MGMRSDVRAVRDRFREAGETSGAMRVLVLHDSPACEIAIKQCNAGVEVFEYKIGGFDHDRAELEGRSGMWDLVITHSHAEGGQVASASPASSASGTPISTGGSASRWTLTRLFGRGRRARFELKEQRVSRSVFLAALQRELGVAIGAIEVGDFETVALLARRFENEGGSYNFTKISGLGAALSAAVQSKDIPTARKVAHKLMAYLGKAMERAAA